MFINILSGILLKGNMLTTHRTLSLIVLMLRSAPGTCSSLEHMLRRMPMPARGPRKHSNSPSMYISVTLNPLSLYILFTLRIATFSLLALVFFMNSAVRNMMLRDIVVKNGSLFTFIISHSNVIFLYLERMDDGMGVVLLRTCLVFRLVCFPFKEPRLVPNISSAASISSLSVGQLSIAGKSPSTIST